MDYDVSKLELKDDDIVMVTLKTGDDGFPLLAHKEACELFGAIKTTVHPHKVVAFPDLASVEAATIDEVKHLRDCLNSLIDGYNKTKLV